MAFLDLHFFSNVLQKQVAAYTIVPEGIPGPWPVMYLLHGMSDDHTIWMRRTRLDDYLSGVPMVVVMPDGERGFFTNANQGPRWGDYITQELPDFIERTFNVRTDRGGRCIGGLSMGGYGALLSALGRPDRYVSVNSFSGSVMFTQIKRGVVASQEFEMVFGKKVAGTSNDLVHLAKKAKKVGKLPAIRVDCGVDDFLLDDNRKFHAALTKLKVKHEYEEFPGQHNWEYWDAHIREGIAFHRKHLTKK